MIQEERKNLILQELNRTSVVKLEDLSERLRVSIDTVRRDLKALDRAGLVQYIRGGAKAVQDSLQFSHFSGRKIIHNELKRETARKALQLIKRDDVIMLNSGTTTTILAEEIGRSGITCVLITNNIAAAEAASCNTTCRIHLIGGEWDSSEQSTWGSCCLREAETYFPDICFLAVNSLDSQNGLTDFRFHEIPIMQIMAKNAWKTVAVMDSTKLNRLAKKQVFPLMKTPLILMDNQVTSEDKQIYLRAGIRIE
jgi:DeoR/GlpR family transcriptional regulator of sugar metabolism